MLLCDQAHPDMAVGQCHARRIFFRSFVGPDTCFSRHHVLEYLPYDLWAWPFGRGGVEEGPPGGLVCIIIIIFFFFSARFFPSL